MLSGTHLKLGLDLAQNLLSEVIPELQKHFTTLNVFSTLSPIPNFVKWLRTLKILESEDFVQEQMKLLAAEANALSDALSDADADIDVDGKNKFVENVVKYLSDKRNTDTDKFREPIMKLCAYYLVQMKTETGLPFDPVARFHLRNGASLHSLNWMGNPSGYGFQQSLGLMVNYRYDVDKQESRKTRIKKFDVAANVMSMIKSTNN